MSHLWQVVDEDGLPRIVDEIFTLLFGDRDFLRQFNLTIAHIVRNLKIIDYPHLLDEDGKVKRTTYWPEWVKTGLWYRERGRCAICMKDISGLLVPEKDLHIDHIVPIKNGGTNDATNLQCLCSSCNLKKSAGPAETSRHYSLYW